MRNKKSVLINCIILIVFFLIVLFLWTNREQVIAYNIYNNMDATLDLYPGDVLVQTYTPNRKQILALEYYLSDKNCLKGKYTLIISNSDNLNDSYIYKIENEYNNENVDSLYFILPDTFYPTVGERLWFYLVSDSQNDYVPLALDASFSSCYLYNGNDSKLLDGTLCIDVYSVKNNKIFLLSSILFIIYGMSSLISHFLKWKFEETVGTSIIFSVIIIYLFGMTGNIKMAIPFLYFLSIVGFGIIFLYSIKKNKLFISYFTFTHCLWGIVFLIIFVFVKHTIIGDPDSIFYIQKALYMFYYDKLAFSEGYVFFIPAFSYLWESINGVFSEDLLLISINIYELSLLFSFIDLVPSSNNVIFENIEKTSMIILCIFLAMLVKTTAFFTIMMDIPFCITVAYIIKIVFSKHELDTNSIIKIVIGAISLVMIKRAGLPLLLILCVVLVFRGYRNKNVIGLKRYFICVFLVLSLSFTFLKLVDVYTSDSNLQAEKIEIQEFELQENDLISNNETQENNTELNIIVIKKLINAFFSTKICCNLSYAQIMSFIFAIAVVIYLYEKDKVAYTFLIRTIDLLLIAGLYYFVICYKYLFAIETQGKENLNAFDRYSIHVIGAVLIYFTIACLMYLLENERLNNYELKNFFAIIAVMSIVVSSFDYQSLYSWIEEDTVIIEENDNYLKKMLTLYLADGHNMFVYSADGTFDEYGYYCKNMNINSWPNNISYSNANIVSVEDKELFIEYLYQNEEYFYLVNYDDAFIENCADLFINGENDIKRHSLYSISYNENGTLVLKFLGQVTLADGILRSSDGKNKLSEIQ